MPCMVVVGGFWGDEGKGKVVSYLALRDRLDVCVRVGSINAAHTVVHEGRKVMLHLVPSAFVHDECLLLIGPGSNVSVDMLLDEIKLTGTEHRFGVDHRVSIIEEKHSLKDRTDEHLRSLGTTGWGVGPAIEDRVGRRARLAQDVPELKKFLMDVPAEVNSAIDAGKQVLLEGVQGLGLSLYHGTYPYVTGRDTTAPSVCGEAGVGPGKIDSVLVVYKAYMTRVGAGHLPGELPKEEAIRRGWFEISGTGRERRSAPIDFELARRAVMLNGATEAALTKVDVLFPSCKGARRFDALPEEARDFISGFERRAGVKVTLIGTGPDALDLIDRRG